VAATDPSAPDPAKPEGGSKRLTVDLPRGLHRRLKTRAAEQETTMAEVLRQMLTDWLDCHDR
jgi:hypothetical protein